MVAGAHSSKRSLKKGLFAAAATALLLAQGCASANVSNETTGSIARSAAPARSVADMSQSELQGAIRSYGTAYESNPKDKSIGMSYAAALQMAGRNDQSLAVMQQVAIANPKDRDVLAAYGKALAAAGDLPKALETIRRAQTPDYPDWRLYSAEGAILDQMGQSDEARTLYRKALDIEPNEPAILSNLGMSYLLTDDLKTAENYLRTAAAQPGGDARIRQNLAMVVGLQGRFDEAQKIATKDLSPQEAEANMAFLKKMLAQENTWSKLKAQDKPAAG